MFLNKDENPKHGFNLLQANINKNHEKIKIIVKNIKKKNFKRRSNKCHIYTE